MAIHPPKLISTEQGLGYNTSKEMRLLGPGLAVTTETWGELEEPWSEGDVVIAKSGYKWVSQWKVGQRYIPTKFFNEEGALVGIYCDISSPVEHADGTFIITDAYLDVWYVQGRSPVLLDLDELEEAVKRGYMNTSEARRAKETAHKLLQAFTANPSFLDF